MPRVKKVEAAQSNQGSILDIFQQIRWGESYTSLLLGLLVVVIVSILLITFLRTRADQKAGEQQVSSDSTQKQEESQKSGEGIAKYTVAEGDTLWSISEKFYASGLNWVVIAKENKISNPTEIEVGDKLVIPTVDPQKLAAQTTISETPKQTQQQSDKITDRTYTVKPGDNLWDIAVRSYGDGFRWVDIARENKLANPDLIHSGNVFTLPS